jgi:hypothetical protein
MSILSDVLTEEYERQKRIHMAYLRECNDLPPGSLVYKQIGQNKYPYLQWREGNKIKSKFVKSQDIPEIIKKCSRKKELRQSIIRIKRDIKNLEKMLKHA